MNEQQWSICKDPRFMLRELDRGSTLLQKTGRLDNISDRKLRLYAAGCYRLHGKMRGHRSAERIEKWAETEVQPPGWGSMRGPVKLAEHASVWNQEGREPSEDLLRSRSDLLRDIVGNPFNFIVLDKRVLTPTVLSLALAAYEERGTECYKCTGSGFIERLEAPASYSQQRLDYWIDPDPSVVAGTIIREECTECENGWKRWMINPDRLLVLSDAAEEAGCYDLEALNHLRDQSVDHYRGCWVLDLFLGRK